MLLYVCLAEEAPAVLLRLLGEEGRVVVDAGATVPMRPVIAEDDLLESFTVYIEGCRVAEAEKLEEALLLFAEAHFVFHQKVSRATRSTMWLMAREVMGLAAESTPTADAIKNMAELRYAGEGAEVPP
eukprot:GHVH01011940.1.p1 GENE.GHVH01011940.1~~GHVH01011940.1.p1  ORF type:complete len:128 (-),score=26.75 GHVH01011940.1:58-441(-)